VLKSVAFGLETDSEQFKFLSAATLDKRNAQSEEDGLMECFSSRIGKRLVRCRTQRMQAKTKEEADRFLAEEQGLIDAMLGRNRVELDGQGQQSRRESYEIGFLDGIILMSLQQGNLKRPSILRTLKQWLCADNPFSR
jgi:hypothetical protein